MNETCSEPASWFKTAWQEPAGIEALAAHIYRCPLCRMGRIGLPEDFHLDTPLSHQQCQASFPVYYEATRPEYPLVSVPGRELVAVALHLATCRECRDQYDALCMISDLEERGVE